ncbi:hypothetical protein RRG08_032615 [Elysia crispata]|uniref:Nuclear receptor domain-containing protein n=1 Tax=Elysia crispata TaxID=231223 RepID=A0AAE0XZY2_9GAST|nr:hypothetical protein RRG08_032615 [Elysia crispata]
MRGKKRPPEERVSNKAGPLPPCKICGEPAAGFHYGVNTCEACKGFFRRSLLRRDGYTCLGSGNCPIGTNRRKSCPKCRYDRCVEFGMSKDAIKTGRYTCKKRNQDCLEVKISERVQRETGLAATQLADIKDPSKLPGYGDISSSSSSSSGNSTPFSEINDCVGDNSNSKIAGDIVVEDAGSAEENILDLSEKHLQDEDGSISSKESVQSRKEDCQIPSKDEATGVVNAINDIVTRRISDKEASSSVSPSNCALSHKPTCTKPIAPTFLSPSMSEDVSVDAFLSSTLTCSTTNSGKSSPSSPFPLFEFPKAESKTSLFRKSESVTATRYAGQKDSASDDARRRSTYEHPPLQPNIESVSNLFVSDSRLSDTHFACGSNDFQPIRSTSNSSCTNGSIPIYNSNARFDVNHQQTTESKLLTQQTLDRKDMPSKCDSERFGDIYTELHEHDESVFAEAQTHSEHCTNNEYQRQKGHHHHHQQSQQLHHQQQQQQQQQHDFHLYQPHSIQQCNGQHVQSNIHYLVPEGQPMRIHNHRRQKVVYDKQQNNVFNIVETSDSVSKYQPTHRTEPRQDKKEAEKRKMLATPDLSHFLTKSEAESYHSPSLSQHLPPALAVRLESISRDCPVQFSRYDADAVESKLAPCCAVTPVSGNCVPPSPAENSFPATQSSQSVSQQSKNGDCIRCQDSTCFCPSHSTCKGVQNSAGEPESLSVDNWCDIDADPNVSLLDGADKSLGSAPADPNVPPLDGAEKSLGSPPADPNVPPLDGAEKSLGSHDGDTPAGGDPLPPLPSCPPVPQIQYSEVEIEDLVASLVASHQRFIYDSISLSEEFLQKGVQECEERCHLQEEVFGQMGFIEQSEYEHIYKSTGLDLDNRFEKIAHLADALDSNVRQVISFVKAIPGFKDISLNSQKELLKASISELYFLGYHRSFLRGYHLIVDMKHAYCVHKILTLYPKEYIKRLFKLAFQLQNLKLSPKTTVMLKVLCVFFPDRADVDDRYQCEVLLDKYLQCFLHQLKQDFPSNHGLVMAKLTQLLTDLRVVEVMSQQVWHTRVSRYETMSSKPILVELFA